MAPLTRSRPSTKKGAPLLGVLAIFVMCAASFYAGIFVGVHMDKSSSSSSSSKVVADSNNCWTADDPRLAKFVKEKVDAKLQQQEEIKKDLMTDNGETLRIPQSSMGRVINGMGRVDRDAFANRFDTGVPLDPSGRGNQDVLILYSGVAAMPQNQYAKQQITSGHEIPLLNSVEEATENCDNLHIVLTHQDRTRQCVALMGQYESFHIQKYMRLPEEKGGIDPNLPLRIVNRGAQSSGRKSTQPPTREQTLEHWSVLATYLRTFSEVLAKLEPYAKKVATKNTVIVMVCNLGQSELLMNFACNARVKGLDVSNVLVFATDIETKELAESIGLTAFFDETNFGRMPKQAAKRYADKNFMAMMGAKVYCVQMVSMLGYDVLFQDVDVVWYKNPLTWFHDESNPDYNFDVYFQDDGNHALYYAPYSANTGFYYVRHNDKTQYFFNSLLMAGDLILSTHSHQIALIALLNEHASMYNLKVKILERNTEEFPGGYTFHRKKDFMMDLFAGDVKPYIFHMSWTLNKDNKMYYFRQMGEWYLNEECVSKPLSKIEGGTMDGCCAAEPVISCHYRDKPSKIPCKDSPAIDGNRPSWWK
jgi:hypothetical protein